MIVTELGRHLTEESIDGADGGPRRPQGRAEGGARRRGHVGVGRRRRRRRRGRRALLRGLRGVAGRSPTGRTSPGVMAYAARPGHRRGAVGPLGGAGRRAVRHLKVECSHTAPLQMTATLRDSDLRGGHPARAPPRGEPGPDPRGRARAVPRPGPRGHDDRADLRAGRRRQPHVLQPLPDPAGHGAGPRRRADAQPPRRAGRAGRRARPRPADPLLRRHRRPPRRAPGRPTARWSAPCWPRPAPAPTAARRCTPPSSSW